jgi:hypothetical protein
MMYWYGMVLKRKLITGDDDVLNEDWIKKPHGSLSSFAVAGAGRHRFPSPNIEKE